MIGTLRFRVGKLIRDGLPASLRASGLRVFERGLGDAEYAHCLKEKLQEEAGEVAQTRSRQELVEELADMNEVMIALCVAAGIGSEELETCRQHKRLAKGGFEGRIYNAAVEVPVGHPAAEYYLNRLERYPLISADAVRGFEYRRRGDDLIYRFHPLPPRAGTPEAHAIWQRDDGAVHVHYVPTEGWLAVDRGNTVVARPWVAERCTYADRPPAGEWVSRKADKAYVYDLVYDQA
jgi:predicted house-cleaning noncanonical NTP pyrophosphatase (MazG superfamily)